MPYHSINDLPPAVKTRYTEKGQRVFLRAFNASYGKYGETSAFKIAHRAASKVAGAIKRKKVKHG